MSSEEEVRRLKHENECEWCRWYSTDDIERDYDWQIGAIEYETIHSCDLDVFSPVEDHLWIPNQKIKCKYFEHKFYGVEACPKCGSENFGATEIQEYHLILYCYDCGHEWRND